MMAGVLRVCVLCLACAGVAAAARDVTGGDSWDVRTRGGVVRGARAPAGGYYSFLGIPFGAPPTGEYRFKAPRPAAPWAGVLEARSSRLCPQPAHGGGGGGGSEDCLALDVFAPAPPAPTATPRPVLAYFHGGGFLFNTRPLTVEAVAPLLKHGVILVTINYRLGALGFLCLGTDEVPGNAGLKDLILGLEWVQQNIATFGGDPARVTAGGTSVGGAAAQLLAVSRAGDGLFRRAICMDGTALADKSLVTYPITNARIYAKMLGFESEDVPDLTKFYKEVPAEKIVNQSMDFFNLDNGEFGFGPCVEREGLSGRRAVAEAPVLTLEHNARPTLFTYCDDEGSVRTDLVRNQRRYNTDFPAFMPANLDFPSDEVKYEESNRTKEFYFGNKTISPETAIEFSQFWGEREITSQAVYSAGELARRGGSAHLLQFSHVGGLSYSKDDPRVPGSAHGDIFNYLFPKQPAENDDDHRVVDEITSIMANFIKTGCARASAPWPAAVGAGCAGRAGRAGRAGSAGRAGRLARLRVAAEAAPREEPTPAALGWWGRLYRLYRRTDYRRLVRP